MSTQFYANSLTLLPSRISWIRFNRLLAWSMIVSPLVEFIFSFNFKSGFVFDLCLFLAHGVLSLILFGVPKMKGKNFVWVIHVFGLRPLGMTPRNNFLMSGYRIALCFFAFFLTSYLAAVVSNLFLLLLLLVLYPIFRLPVSIIQHVYDAIGYAQKRWKNRFINPGVITAIYVLLLFVNLLWPK